MMALGITSVGGGIGQSVLQALRFANLGLQTVGMDARAMSPGLYWADTAYLTPPFAGEKAYLERLLEICDRESIDLLIPGLDTELPILSRHREQFVRRNCAIVVAATEAIELCNDKYACYQFCKQRALPFVTTCLISQAQARSDEFDYPVIVKPRRGSASVGAWICRNATELLETPSDDSLIVQSYLSPDTQKPDTACLLDSMCLDQSNEISCQYFVGPSGKVLGRFASVNRLKNGIPIEIVPDPDSAALDVGILLVEALIEKGLRGPINLQGRVTRDGVLFFETNARFTGITATRAAMGYREVEAAIWAFCKKDERRAAECLQSHPGSVGLRYVANMTVTREKVQQVALSLDRKPQSVRTAVCVPKCVLVTGASGYIGAALVARFLADPEIGEVRAAVRNEQRGAALRDSLAEDSRLKIVLGELSGSPWDVDGVDVVVHAAAIRAAADPLAFFRTNSEGVGRLFEVMQGTNVRRFVYLSSQSIYGMQRKPPWTECMPPRPETPYALSKWLGETVCLSGESNVPEVAVLRMARVYGLGRFMRWNELSHKFSLLASQGRSLPVHNNGCDKVDLLHVRDLSDAVFKACTRSLPDSPRAVLNIGSGQPVSVSQLSSLCQTIAAERGLQVPGIEHIPTADETRIRDLDIGMDNSLARATLDWEPSVAIKAGMVELFQAALENYCENQTR